MPAEATISTPDESLSFTQISTNSTLTPEEREDVKLFVINELSNQGQIAFFTPEQLRQFIFDRWDQLQSARNLTDSEIQYHYSLMSASPVEAQQIVDLLLYERQLIDLQIQQIQYLMSLSPERLWDWYQIQDQIIRNVIYDLENPMNNTQALGNSTGTGSLGSVRGMQ